MKEVAEFFGVRVNTVRNWVLDGRFPGVIRVGAVRQRLIPHSAREKVREEEAQKLVDQLHTLGFDATITPVN